MCLTNETERKFRVGDRVWLDRNNSKDPDYYSSKHGESGTVTSVDRIQVWVDTGEKRPTIY